MYFRVHLIVILLSSFSLVKCDWIYPGNMVKEQPAKNNGESAGSASASEAKAKVENECNAFKKRLAICDEQLRYAEDSVHRANPGLVLITHFKDFLKTLSNNFCPPKLNEHVQLNFKFSPNNCASLSEFVRITSLDPKDVDEIRQILENFTRTYEWVSDIQFPSSLSLFADFCTDNFHAIFTVMFTFFAVINSFWVFSSLKFTKRLVWGLILALFLISVPWNWWHLYKKIEAGKMATMAKAGKSDPCRERSIWKKFSSMFFLQKDECATHAEASHIHPAIEVTPIMALSVTISRVFLEPLEYIGTGLNKFLTSSLVGLPIMYQAVLAILVSVLAVVFVFLIFGYQFRTLFFTIGPSKRETVNADVAMLVQQNEELQKRILALEALELSTKKLEGSLSAIPALDDGSGDASRCNPPAVTDSAQEDNSPKKVGKQE